MSPDTDLTTTRTPKDRIVLYLQAARDAAKEQRDYYRSRANEIKTGDLNNPIHKREFESVIEDVNRFNFGVEQIEILIRYLG